MNIIEATEIAMKEGKEIYRESRDYVFILPSNSISGYSLRMSNGRSHRASWFPIADDILADDWKVKE